MGLFLFIWASKTITSFCCRDESPSPVVLSHDQGTGEGRGGGYLISYTTSTRIYIYSYLETENRWCNV